LYTITLNAGCDLHRIADTISCITDRHIPVSTRKH